jgi:glycosyltransferase involved in cell wall biosynthesis
MSRRNSSSARSLNSDNPQKVAYITAIFPGVTITFVMREIEALTRMGFEVIVFAIKRPALATPDPIMPQSETEMPCTYARPDNLIRHFRENIHCFLRKPSLYLRSLYGFLRQAPKLEPGAFVRLLFHFFVGVGFSREMVGLNVSHIHGHFAAGTSIALAASLVSGIPFSWSAHASGDIFVKPVLLPEKVERAGFVVAVCEYSKRYLDDVTGLKYSPKIHRIYNGIDCVEHQLAGVGSRSERNPSGKERGPFRVISVGSLVGCKGHGTLIKACRDLKERGHSVVCTIIGDGPERLTLSRLIEELALEGVVSLKGYLNLKSVYAELKESDVFTLLSEIHINGYRDGFPTVILEAMSMSLPIVSTWVSGIPEMVVDGETGFLVHERDHVAAANALERLILSDDMRSAFGKAGKERVERLFNLSESVSRLADLFSNSPGNKVKQRTR